MAKSQKVVATSANPAKLAAAAIMMFRQPSKRGGGRGEQPLDDGTTYDELSEQLIQLGAGQYHVLQEGIHFSPGPRLSSVENRIRKALADPERRDELHRLQANHIAVKAIEAAKQIVDGEMIEFPNSVVIATHPGIAEKYQPLANALGWTEDGSETEETEAVG